MTANRLFTIPAGAPFARSLARGILAETGGDPALLPAYHILLPTRRACRTVREAFLRESEGRPLLLPRLQPLGDVDAEELTIGLAGTEAGDALLALPPAIPPMLRRVLLARIVMALPGYGRGIDPALALADELARLMDQVHTEGLDLAALPALVPGEMARHWEITTGFLKILSEAWPGVLAAQGMIDPADRRNRLLRLLAAHWRDTPPRGKVIAAGSTGSIPATAALLGVIAQLPQGRVVLPGLDQEMDAESWEAVEETHPQAALKHLLNTWGVARTDVMLWPGADDDGSDRRFLAGEVMRPASTTERWNALPQERRERLISGAAGLERQDCETPEDEARVIALAFRETLETEGRTAALVTPDRALARRVAVACRRWGIAVDDSAGRSLRETGPGIFLLLIAQAAAERLAPGLLLALLRHRLCRLDRADVGALETQLLRGPKPPPGFAGLRARAAERTDSAGLTRALTLLDRLEPMLAPLLTLADGEEHAAGLWIEQHIRAAEMLAGGPDQLWRDETGEAASRFFAELQEAAPFLPPLRAGDYGAMLERMMQGVTVRPRYGTHPRLSILGQLEARLLQADRVILGGLNEKSWPPDPGHDPWMSRPMRARFGLPAPERSVGLAAHDFVQCFGAPQVLLTRSSRQDNAPTVPSRWLQRLDTVMQAAGADPSTLLRGPVPWDAVAREMDRSAGTRPCPRPAPCPPLAVRPVELPATRIETWLQDPYSIYARYILGLRKLEPLEKAPDEAARGTFLHEVLNEFVTLYPDELPPDAAQKLIDLGVRKLSGVMDDSSFWQYWMPRFERIAEGLCRHEAEWRREARPALLEIQGKTVLDGFTLTARADRIDRFRDGTMAVIDYKTGSQLSAGAVVSGKAPQLALEAFILAQGGFTDAGPAQTAYLGYWKLTGGAKPADMIRLKATDIPVAIANARNGLAGLIAAYRDPAMPYFSLPDPERLPRFSDYAHLARVQEWSVADDAEASE